jgi:hypothetical protein
LGRRCSTLCLPIGKDAYNDPVTDPARFRAWRHRASGSWPELFPTAFRQGYRRKAGRTSRRAGVRLRRTRRTATGAPFSVRPSFPLPAGAGTAGPAQGPPFLRAFGAPFWARARVCGRDDLDWYRLAVRPGRPSIAGTTARRAGLPGRLLAGEHHQARNGGKGDSATTAGAGCCLGAAWAPTAHAADLPAAYAAFQGEAKDVRADDRPRAVRVDGGASAHPAWRTWYPLAALLRCFPHGGLHLRSRGKRREPFQSLPAKGWAAYRAPDRRAFGPRLRRRAAWARGPGLSGGLSEQGEKPCGRAGSPGWRTRPPGGRRTSNRLDRGMRGMSRDCEGGRPLRGSPDAAGVHVRAWALLHNVRPWGKAAVRANEGWRSPAERVNGHRDHDDGLQNRQVSASRGGYRR